MIPAIKKSRQVLRKRERNQIKEMNKQHNLEKEAFRTMNRLFSEVLTEQRLDELAKKFEVQKRKRELPPFAIVSVLLTGCLNDIDGNPKTLEQMCIFLKKWYSIDIEPQSLSNRINCENTSRFIKDVTTIVLTHELNQALNKVFKKHKSKDMFFARILLQDSTTISLPETMKRIFRGCGGSASEASIKLDYVIDQSNHLIVSLKCHSGRKPDSSLSGDIINVLEEGDLVIRDLGYFNLEQLSKIKQKMAYFISRLSINTNIYLNKDDKQPLDLINHVKNLGDIDTNIYIGDKARLEVRLIALKVPPEVIEARRQQYKRARGRSKEPSEALNEWNGYTFMITNITKEQLSYKMILKMYTIRWQIELFFKNIKSNLHVDKMTGHNKYRIQCLIYIKIIITFLVSILHAFAQMKAVEKEISLPKFTRWLREDGRLIRALLKGDLSDLLKELDSSLQLLCMQKRKKRKGTLQDIQESYQEEHKHQKIA